MGSILIGYRLGSWLRDLKKENHLKSDHAKSVSRTTFVICLLLAALLALAGCGGGSDEDTSATPGDGQALPAAELALVAYSTPQEAYEKIIEAFRKMPQGRSITFSQSYGASGDQSRAVESGLPADVVAFSLEPDVTRLETPAGQTWVQLTRGEAARLAIAEGDTVFLRTAADAADRTTAPAAAP